MSISFIEMMSLRAESPWPNSSSGSRRERFRLDFSYGHSISCVSQREMEARERGEAGKREIV